MMPRGWPTIHRRPLPGLRPSVRALAGILLALALVSCSPTEGDDGTFQSIGRNNTDFGSPFYLVTGNYPVSVSAGDLDNDGDQDLIAFNRLGDNFTPLAIDEEAFATLTVFLNDGTGASFTPSTIQVGSLGLTVGGGVVKVGDLDPATPQDDIAVLVNSPDDPRIWICTDAPACAGASTFPLNNIAAQMELVDLNGGGLDVVVTVPATREIVAVFDGNTGTTQTVTTSTTLPGYFTLGAFDAAGAADDMAVLHPGGQKVTVLFNVAGTLTENATYTLTSTPARIARGDFTADGVDDFAVTQPSSSFVSRWLNNGSGTDFTGSDHLVNENPQYLVTGDFVGDGSDDLIVTHALRTVVSYLNSSFTETLYTVTRDPFDLRVGEVTGDTNLDVIVAEQEDRAISILAGNGSGGFSRTYIGFDNSIQQPNLVNLDGAGESDLVLIQPYKDRLAVLLNP